MAAVTPDACVAFDVGGTSTRAAIIDSGSIGESIQRETKHGSELAAELARLYRELGAQALPVGIAVPGPITSDLRSVAFTGNVGLRNYPLRDLLEQELGVDVRLDDDSNCAAMAEATVGAAGGTASSVTIVIGTGVGAGLVVAGQIFRGAHGTAGEVGHIRLDPHGPPCSCGRSGCFEALANGRALVARVPGAASAEAVFAAARAGDAASVRAIWETAQWAAAGVAAVACGLDPECIVLAGGIGRQPELVETVAEHAPALCIEPVGDSLDVRASALGEAAGLLGAALLLRGLETP